MEMSVIGAKNVANMIIEKYGISNDKNSNVHSCSELLFCSDQMPTYQSEVQIHRKFLKISSMTAGEGTMCSNEFYTDI